MARKKAARRTNRPQRNRKRKRNARTIFFGYPSQPPSLSETIERALGVIERSPTAKQASLRLTPWPEIPNSGKNLFGQIAKAIDHCVVAAFDVTTPNPNVAFEIGYSLARSKRLWLSLNPTTKDSKTHFRTHYTHMLEAGYREYTNHEHLASHFLADKPWAEPNEVLLSSRPGAAIPKTEVHPLLYVTPPNDTTATIDVTTHLQNSALSPSVVTDDPRENGRATLDWYNRNIRDAEAILIHLVSDNHVDADLYNVRASFIAGIAHGLQKPLLMIAHEPYHCPTDYHGILQSHATAEQCLQLVTEWLSDIDLRYRRPRRPHQDGPKSRGDILLRDLTLGESVAENERWTLDEYFVETDWFYQAQEPTLSIMVGRRGSGKTATLYAIEDKYQDSHGVLVCSVQPAGYELGRVIQLLEEAWGVAERGYLIESLWKFLLYTEIAIAVHKDIQTRPAHLQPTPEELALQDFVRPFRQVMLTPFSQRLNDAVNALIGTGNQQDSALQRAKVSEHLHSNYIGHLVRLLRRVLASKDKVLVLVDKLDDRWGLGPYMEAQSILLAGLIEVTRHVMMDFRGKRPDERAVQLSLVVFIRSDIFSNLGLVSGEVDKLPVRRMTWSDGEELLRILEHRLVHVGNKELTPEDIWSKLFAEQVHGLSPRDYILHRALPKPRDILVLTKNAVSAAIKRSHDQVDEDDFAFAYEQYSGHAFDSVVFEDDPERGMLRAVLSRYAGCSEIMPESEVRKRISEAGVTEQDNTFYLELLCDLNVLGIQGPGGYKYPAHEGDRARLLDTGRSFTSNIGQAELTFRVHPAFCPALGIAGDYRMSAT